MTRRSPSTWWEGLGPLEVDGPDGAPPDHRLRWHEGELALTAHPDPEAERALGALGGERCPCLDVLDAWHADHGEGAILAVGARQPDEVLAFPRRSAIEITADLRRWRGTAAALIDDARAAGDLATAERVRTAAAPAEGRAAQRLGFLLLLGLDPVLQLRLQASVAAAFAGLAHHWAALTAATAARAAPVLRRHLGWSGTVGDITLGDDPAITRTTAVLPPRWLADVWARGLAEAVPGRLVVEPGPGGKAQVALGVDPVGESSDPPNPLH